MLVPEAEMLLLLLLLMCKFLAVPDDAKCSFSSLMHTGFGGFPLREEKAPFPSHKRPSCAFLLMKKTLTPKG